MGIREAPALVVMAAGLGRRYGGLKQMAPVDGDGHILMEYALYDAKRAGFDKAVFVVSEGMLGEFRDRVGRRAEKHFDVSYSLQRLADMPGGRTAPAGRTKPWGTAHAALAAKGAVSGNFAAINADDYYGAAAYRSIYAFLRDEARDGLHALIGYRIENTLTAHGHVSRGVCKVTAEGDLAEVVERTRIVPQPGGAAYEDGGSSVFVPGGTIVSMNMWGFGLSMMGEIERRFAAFLDENLPSDPLGCEYFLPFVPNQLLREGKARFKVLPTPDQWYGVTYMEDIAAVSEALERMRAQGDYPRELLA